MSSGFLESIPISGVCIGVALLMLVFCEVGYLLGKRFLSREDRAAPESLGPMVGGLLGMLGFVLALTFSMAAGQHDLRKRNVLDEANAIGTAYMRADLLGEPYASAVKQLLREYVRVRVDATQGADLARALARSVEIHGLVWAQVSAAALATPGTNTSLAVQATNEVIDMHERRVSGGLHNRVPATVWIALVAICALTMITMGLQVGYSAKRRLGAVVPLSLAFAVLVTLVVDLDRPLGGLIRVGQQAMIDLDRGMGGDAR